GADTLDHGATGVDRVAGWAARGDRAQESLLPEPFAGRRGGVGDAVGEQHEALAGPDLEPFDAQAQAVEHADQRAAALDPAWLGAGRRREQRHLVARVGERE